MLNNYHTFILGSAGLAVVILALAPTTVSAEQVAKFADYDVYYTVINSLLIPEEVARRHQIVRSKNRMVTNISIKKDNQSVKAGVSGSATNLLNQLLTLDFNEVKEDQAIYYLATLLVQERDTLRFSLNISVDREPQPFVLEFKRQYNSAY